MHEYLSLCKVLYLKIIQYQDIYSQCIHMDTLIVFIWIQSLLRNSTKESFIDIWDINKHIMTYLLCPNKSSTCYLQTVLSKDILFYIFSTLPFIDIFRSMKISKYFYNLLHSEQFWQSHCMHNNIPVMISSPFIYVWEIVRYNVRLDPTVTVYLTENKIYLPPDCFGNLTERVKSGCILFGVKKFIDHALDNGDIESVRIALTFGPEDSIIRRLIKRTEQYTELTKFVSPMCTPFRNNRYNKVLKFKKRLKDALIKADVKTIEELFNDDKLPFKITSSTSIENIFNLVGKYANVDTSKFILNYYEQHNIELDSIPNTMLNNIIRGNNVELIDFVFERWNPSLIVSIPIESYNMYKSLKRYVYDEKKLYEGAIRGGIYRAVINNMESMSENYTLSHFLVLTSCSPLMTLLLCTNKHIEMISTHGNWVLNINPLTYDLLLNLGITQLNDIENRYYGCLIKDNLPEIRPMKYGALKSNKYINDPFNIIYIE